MIFIRKNLDSGYNNLKDEVSGHLFTAPNNFTLAAPDYWKYSWMGTDTPAVPTLSEGITVTISAQEQTCRVYQVKAITPEGIECDWSNEIIISDQSITIPYVKASGN